MCPIYLAIFILLLSGWYIWKKLFNEKLAPPFKFPFMKHEMFSWIQKTVATGELPKIFRPEVFKYSYHFSSSIIISDYELMTEAFNKPELASRLDSLKLQNYTALERKDDSVPELAASIIGSESHLVKNGMGSPGMTSGLHDDNNKLLRATFHKTIMKLNDDKKMDEIIEKCADQVCEALQEGPESGLDPRNIFTNGALNVVSGFSIGKVYNFDHPDFQIIINYVKQTFATLAEAYVTRLITEVTPNFLLQMKWYRTMRNIIRKKMLKNPEGPNDFMPFMLRQIKLHQDKIDENDPQDYLDFLILAGKDHSTLGYMTICDTMEALWIGASETTSNTLRWLIVVLATYEDIQQKCYQEICDSIEKHGEILRDECPYISSVLLENMRFWPVVDSLPHQATETVELAGYTIPKGAPLLGSMTAIHHNPKHFDDPGTFKADRFVKDGIFCEDEHVCNFANGLRRCVGKKLLGKEYFKFATEILKKFELKLINGTLEPGEHSGLLLPKDDIRIYFKNRNSEQN